MKKEPTRHAFWVYLLLFCFPVMAAKQAGGEPPPLGKSRITIVPSQIFAAQSTTGNTGAVVDPSFYDVTIFFEPEPSGYYTHYTIQYSEDLSEFSDLITYTVEEWDTTAGGLNQNGEYHLELGSFPTGKFYFRVKGEKIP